MCIDHKHVFLLKVSTSKLPILMADVKVIGVYCCSMVKKDTTSENPLVDICRWVYLRSSDKTESIVNWCLIVVLFVDF